MRNILRNIHRRIRTITKKLELAERHMATGLQSKYSYQEFKCNKCPGFFVVRLNTVIRGKVLMVCPVCGRGHQRDVVVGVIVDIGKEEDESRMQKVLVPKAAFTKTPKTKKLKMAHENLDAYDRQNRNGAVIQTPDDLVDPTEFYKYGE